MLQRLASDRHKACRRVSQVAGAHRLHRRHWRGDVQEAVLLEEEQICNENIKLVNVQLCCTDWLREGFLRVDVLERRQLLVVVDLDQVRARCESDVPALHLRLVTRSALVQGSTCYATHCLPVVDDLHQGFGVFLDPENCRQRRDVVNVCFVSLSILLRMTQNYCQSLLKAKHKK